MGLHSWMQEWDVQNPSVPIYLTGASNQWTVAEARADLYGKLGVLLTMGNYNSYADKIQHYSHWAGDNGCFANAGAFDADEFYFQLDKICHQTPGSWDKCLFAVAPDVFDITVMRGDPLATIERSLPEFNKIRSFGIPAALVYQDGLEQHMDKIPWDDFDVAFIGGGDEFKLGYYSYRKAGNPHYRLRQEPREDGTWVEDERTVLWARLIAETHRRGKWLHVGRVNSEIRYNFCYAIGAGSADGNYIGRGPKINLPKVKRWITTLEQRARCVLKEEKQLLESVLNFRRELL